jgi:hypothetical protein
MYRLEAQGSNSKLEVDEIFSRFLSLQIKTILVHQHFGVFYETF